jgi:hypothetical protein
MIHIGFTGTRKGMTEAQLKTVRILVMSIASPDDAIVHHGDCIGADAEFDCIAKDWGLRRVGHPCNLENMRTHCDVEETREVKSPLVRNRDIVNRCEVMIAAPAEATPQQRGGTWATIRYATGRTQIFTVWPDGTYSEDSSHVK